MDSFDAATAAYQARSRQSITYRTVSFPIFEQFYSAVRDLRRYERENGLDDEWLHVLRTLSRYRYDTARVPLPFNHPYHQSRIDFEALTTTVSSVQQTRPTLAPIAQSAAKCLEYLLDSSLNPLLDEILATLDSHRRDQPNGAIVLAHSRFISPFREFLHSKGISAFEIIDPNALRRLRFWDRLVYVGAVRDFDDHVFSSPRTFRTDVVGFPWQQGKWEQAESFLGGRMGRSQTRQRFARSSQAHTDTLNTFDVEAIDHLLREEAYGDQDEESSSTTRTEVRLHELFGGKGVLLEVSDRQTNMVIDLDADPEDRVRQVADRQVEEGMFIVLRTGERGSYLAPIADQRLGKPASTYRALLGRWKATLRRLDRVAGTQALVESLKEAGSGRATYQNVRNWMSAQSIAPESDEDFRAIAIVCGMEPEFPAMRHAAAEIRKAHIYAGQWVRRKLLEIVQISDVEDIELEGFKQFEIPEFESAQLTAYRIESRSERISYASASSIEKVFDLDVFKSPSRTA